MPNDPKFVRLADHMSDRTISDIAGGSGWSISGRDVRPFPKRADQQRFVRQKLAANLLEPAGKAEFDEVSKHDAKFAKLAEDHPGQEGKLQDLVDEVNDGNDSSSDDADDDEDDKDGKGN